MSDAHAGLSAQTVPKRHLVAPTLFAVATIVLLMWGYWQRDDSVLSAETGLGYLLGFIGSVMMLLLLTYPLAKRARWVSRLVAVKHWFKIHMMLGILGPTAILFHSNFQMGSMNSSVALICMLLVVASGIVGRYFYSKVHLGLYGQKASWALLLETARQQQESLKHQFGDYPDMVEHVENIYRQLLPSSATSFSAGAAMLAAPRRSYYRWRFHRAMRRHHDQALQRLWRESQKTMNSYLETLRKLAQLQFFERLLSWWHILHMPIFIMMFITSVIHVWAVHRY